MSAGPNLFVFTAGDPSARQHLSDTVINPIAVDRIRAHVEPGEWASLMRATPSRRFFAWGATPGPGNRRTWEALEPGDFVLAYYEFAYHFVSQVTLKLRNAGLAKELWGTNSSGDTWEFVYFLDEPKPIHLDSRTLADVSMPPRYQGFMRVKTAIPVILERYGSLGQFVDRRLLGTEPTPNARVPVPAAEPANLREVRDRFVEALGEADLKVASPLVDSLLASLITKPFVILTGLSGSGKSQIAIQLGKWFGETRYFAAVVRPDWTGPEAMLGYPDLLQKPEPDGKRAWVVNEVLAFVLRAAQHEDTPHLLLLDEMNLAHVERYFADFLSGMESGEPILPNLLEQEGTWVGQVGGDHLVIPSNLFVVGTVNVDETTYAFSPKVLDRANTIEFRVATSALTGSDTKPSDVIPATAELLASLLAAARDQTWHQRHRPPFHTEFQAAVTTLHATLSVVNWEFGYRTYHDMLRYAAVSSALSDASLEHILDTQVLQKILPRIHGSRRRLEPVLSRLGRFCHDLSASDRSPSDQTRTYNPLSDPPDTVRLPGSHDKVRRMYQAVLTNQFASFND